MYDAEVHRSASLDPHETNVDYQNNVRESITALRTAYRVDPSQHLTTDPLSFRHSGWALRRARILRALQRNQEARGRIDRFAHCGSNVHVFRSDDDPTDYQLRGNYCHDRFCTPCARAKAQRIAENMKAIPVELQMRMITLTVKSTTEDLPRLINHLYASFRRLRQSRSWKRYVRGGAAFLEVKFNPTLERWHPHLHVLVEGVWYPHRLLKGAWYKATGGSFIVDIRLVHKPSDAIAYVVKYAGKAVSSHIINEPRLLDLALTAFRGRRLCLTVGSWRKYPLLQLDDPGQWHWVGDLDRILSDYNSGNSFAHEIVTALLSRAAPIDLITYEHLPNAPP